MTIPPVAIVTGAGSGIGRSICELLAEEKCRIALVGRTESKLQETVDLIAADVADPPDTLIIAADITDAEQAYSSVDMTLKQWGQVDVLINNAGAAPFMTLDQFDAEGIYQCFAVNMFGPLYLTQRCWPAFRKHKRGMVVNVSSMSAFDPFPGLGVYGAAKAAVDGLTRAIVNEGGELGIKAYSVAPGAVETSMLRSIFDKRNLPADQTLDPQEVAQVVVDCAFGRRSEAPGSVIRVQS